jgi:hypothetical protein
MQRAAKIATVAVIADSDRSIVLNALSVAKVNRYAPSNSRNSAGSSGWPDAPSSRYNGQKAKISATTRAAPTPYKRDK